MSPLRNLSIRNKLIFIILAVMAVNMIASLVIGVVTDRAALRDQLAESVGTELGLIGEYCISPLAFDDREGAEEIISRAETMPHVLNVALYDPDGRLFAEYLRTEAHRFPDRITRPPSVGFADGYYFAQEDIVFQEHRYGSIYLRASTTSITAAMRKKNLTRVVIWSTLMVVSCLLALVLQRIISEPLQRITEVTRRVSEQGDLEVRLREDGRDEIATLSRGFNEMLRQLETRQKLQQEAEAAAASSLRFLQTILDTLPSAVFYKGLDGRYLGCNRAMEEFVGRPRDEIVGATRVELAAPGGSDEHARIDAELLEHGGVRRYERRVPDVEGGERDVVFQKALFSDSDGAPAGIVGVILDVTDHRRAEADRATLREQLAQAQKMEAVGRLAGGVAHDFNNILMVISNYSSMLLDDLPPGAPMTKEIAAIHQSAARAADLTRQLLAFGRKQIIRPAAMDVNAVVERSWDMLSRLLGEDIDLQFAPASDLCTVWFDPGQMDQILLNLAVNARDAMPDGGRLTVATENAHLAADRRGDRSLVRAGDYVLLTVRDTGQGMDEETLANVFEPFFTTKDVGKGTGLGMAMVYGIVNQHGGTIEIWSELGRGTCVSVYLPVTEQAVDATEKSDHLPTTGDGHETILVLEDEESVRDITDRMLASRGYQVIAVDGFQAAAEVIARPDQSVDLLITDVVMPEMNGRKCFERLRAIRSDLRVLYISGYNEDVIARHSVLASDTDFLQKPFSVDELTRKVRAVLA